MRNGCRKDVAIPHLFAPLLLSVSPPVSAQDLKICKQYSESALHISLRNQFRQSTEKEKSISRGKDGVSHGNLTSAHPSYSSLMHSSLASHSFTLASNRFSRSSYEYSGRGSLASTGVPGSDFTGLGGSGRSSIGVAAG